MAGWSEGDRVIVCDGPRVGLTGQIVRVPKDHVLVRTGRGELMLCSIGHLHNYSAAEAVDHTDISAYVRMPVSQERMSTTPAHCQAMRKDGRRCRSTTGCSWWQHPTDGDRYVCLSHSKSWPMAWQET